MSRNTIWWELFDHMADDRCPVCALTDRRVRQAMDGFLYEGVNDPGIREKLKKSHGFCGFHAGMLAEKGDPLAHALIYGELLEQAGQMLLAKRFDELKAYGNRTDCHFCQMARECEHGYIAAFLQAYRDEEFRKRYLEDGILCLAHLQMCVGRGREGPSPIAGKIAADTAQKYRGVCGDLAAVRRKHDYRFANEPYTGRQSTSWKRAVQILNDRCGVRK